MFSGEEGNLLKSICQKHDIPVQLVVKLLDIERQVQGMKRRAAVYSRIEDVLNEEWRTEEEIIKQ